MHKLCAYQFWIGIDLERMVEGEGKEGDNMYIGGSCVPFSVFQCTHLPTPASDMWQSQVENEL